LCSRYFNPSYDVSEASYKSINAKTAKQGVAGGYPEVAFDALTKVLDLRYETVAYDTLLTHMITLPPPPSGDPEDIPPYVMVVRSAKRRGHFGMNSSQELPEEIFVHVGKGIEVYELDHCILGFNMESAGYGHAICGAFCKNDPVIFDSNRHHIVNYDWTRLTNEVPTSLQPYKVSDGSFGYSYVIYTRKVLVDYLITRPSQQVCVQQVDNEYRIQTYGDGLLFLKDNKEFAYLQPSLFPPIRSFVDKDIQVRTFERIDSNKIVVATKDESVVLKVSDRHIYGMGPGGKEQPFGMLFQFPT
jgi:hypothetical protein